jgi:hypothetical protein
MTRDRFAQYQFSGHNAREAWSDSGKYAEDTKDKFKSKPVFLRFFIFVNLMRIIRKNRKSKYS